MWGFKNQSSEYNKSVQLSTIKIHSFKQWKRKVVCALAWKEGEYKIERNKEGVRKKGCKERQSTEYNKCVQLSTNTIHLIKLWKSVCSSMERGGIK